MSDPQINLAEMNILLVDPDHATRDLIVQMLRSFGAPLPARAETGAAAQAYLESHQVDLCLCDAALPDTEGAELIEWMRHSERRSVRSVPIIVLTGDTQLATIAKVRDSGANIVVKRPVAPQTLYEHIVWVLTVHRPMVEADHYVGPDRRFHEVPLPEDGERRTSPAFLAQPERDAGETTQTQAPDPASA